MNPDRRLSPNFWLSEFTNSQTAARRGIKNDPDQSAVDNLKRLAKIMEAVRTTLGSKAILISSGYRCPTLNTLVGGSYTSAHLSGRACDFTCPSYGDPLEVAQRLSDSGLAFDKLIYEGTWIHLQIAEVGKQPRRAVYTAHFRQDNARYTEGLA